MFRYILLSIFISASANALSPQIEVSGRAYSDSNCRYYTSSSADFQFTYSTFKGARPKVLFSFGGEKLGRSVAGMAGGEVLMKLRADGSAFTEITQRVDERGSFFYKTLTFRVQWEDTDGQIRKTDAFSVNVPSRQCQPGEFEELEIH